MPTPYVAKAKSAPTEFPFLLKVLITVVVNNAAGVEQKKVLPAVFQVDANGASMPWYVLRNFLVPDFLKKNLGPEGQAWIKIYEIKIEKLVNRKDPKNTDVIPVRVMTLDQLESYCKEWELAVRPADFHSIEYARQMVVLFQTDPKGYRIQYEDYINGKKRQYPELDNMRKNVTAASGPNLDEEFEALEAGRKISAPPTRAPTAADAAPVRPETLSAQDNAALNDVPRGTDAPSVDADLPPAENQQHTFTVPAPEVQPTIDGEDPFSKV